MTSPSGIRTELEALLKRLNVDTVVLAGYSTDRCVGLTAIDAWERDFNVILAGEAMLGTDPENGQLMLNYLRKAFGLAPATNEEVKRTVTARLEKDHD